MTQFPGKRKPEIVDLTQDDGPARASKTPRTESAFDAQTVTPGHRFGESEDFIALNQLSQTNGVDDEDAQAAELVQGSHESGDNVLYSMQYSLSRQVKRLTTPQAL